MRWLRTKKCWRPSGACAAPELINEIGDLMFQSADFPLADKIAERIKRKIRAVTPWLLDDQPGPVIAQLNKQIQSQAQQVAELLQKLAEKQIALKGKDEKRDIEASRAETDRLNTVGKVIKDFHEVGLAHRELDQQADQTLHDMHMDHIDQIQEDNQQTIDQQGAKE